MFGIWSFGTLEFWIFGIWYLDFGFCIFYSLYLLIKSLFSSFFLRYIKA